MSPLPVVLAFALVLGWLVWMSLTEIRRADPRGGQALYLVSRVGARLGYPVRERPLALLLPQGPESVLHFHLLTPGHERDSITLKTVRPTSSPLGDFVIDSDPSRMVVGGLSRVPLGEPRFDRVLRIFARNGYRDRLRNRLVMHDELLHLVRDLACRSRHGHFELADLGGQVKIQFDDRTIRFPSDVEKVTLALVRLFEVYRRMGGAASSE